MLHVKMRDGFTIAVSEAKHISQVARRTVLSTNALAVLGPILEETVGWERTQIRQFFESYGILIQEWDSVRTDWLTLRPAVKKRLRPSPPAPESASRLPHLITTPRVTSVTGCGVAWVALMPHCTDNRASMLRDKNLIPLSHQHQHCLALCVRLDRAIQAGEVDLEAWQAEIQQIFEQEISFHFAAEEKELFPVAARFPELQPLVQELADRTRFAA